MSTIQRIVLAASYPLRFYMAVTEPKPRRVAASITIYSGRRTPTEARAA